MGSEGEKNKITSRGRKILDFMLIRRKGLSDSLHNNKNI